MLIDGWWGNQNDPRGVSSYLRVGDYFLQVVFVLNNGDVLLIGSIWQRSIVGAKKHSLSC